MASNPIQPMSRVVTSAIFITAWFGIASTLAQETGGLSVRAMLLVPGGAVTNLHPLVGDKAGDAVQVGARGLSQPFSPAARGFALAVPSAQEASGYRAVATVALPAKGRDFIVLLEPAGQTYQVHVVNRREARFGADCVLFFNTAGTVLGATLGSQKVLIKPRQMVFAKAPERGEKPYYQVTFYHPDGGKSRIFGNSRWPHRDHGRTYVFLYRSQPANRLTFEAVDEGLEPETKTE
jgi:hypothetical protein